MISKKRVLTFGTFDLFHYGHLSLLKRAANLGDELVVGVSSDEFNQQKKGRVPTFSFTQRCEMLHCLDFVDKTFKEDSFAQKADYIRHCKADILVMGSDWAGAFDHFKKFCHVVYLERTPEISSSIIKNAICTETQKHPGKQKLHLQLVA